MRRDMKYSIEWQGEKAVMVFTDDMPVVVGVGMDRATTLHDAWTTTAAQGRSDVARFVADTYRKLTGRDPTR